MDAIERDLLLKIADLHDIPEGAYNIRENGQSAGRGNTANIEIVGKTDGKSGIDIFIKPGTKKESVHIPVILSKAGWQEMVYNDFYIGEDADVVIVAGCGIHNCGGAELTSRHDGVHTFYVGKNARVKYIEKHYGEGDGNGENIKIRLPYFRRRKSVYRRKRLILTEVQNGTERGTKSRRRKIRKKNKRKIQAVYCKS